MAIALENKTRVDAPDSDYPYGKIRDKTESEGGTPVNTEVYGDFHQFFAKLLDEAGVTPNGLPDNAYTGFQLFEALWKAFSNVRIKTKVIEIGDWNMDSTQSVNVAHGLVDGNKIRSIDAVIIRDDNQTLPFMQINSASTAQLDAGYPQQLFSSGFITLLRRDGGVFDSNLYDSTSFNRGFITITYED